MTRLDKIVTSQKEITRSDCRRIIRSGRVSVNGVVCRDPASKWEENTAEIALDGVPLLFQKYVYYMMNKPQGVLCVSRDPKVATVVDLLPPEWKRKGLFPAGRLDKDTVGLVILTDDGDFAHRMLSPRKKIFKHYRAVIDGPITDREIEQFRTGVMLTDGQACLPAELETVADGENPTVDVKICEGRFHQVKRMFIAVGRKVLWLKRVSIGRLALDESLPEGGSRPLTEAEKAMIFQ